MKAPKLTANDQRILDEVQRLVRQNEKLTCAQIAEQLQIAPSSIIKLAKKLGYSGWNDLYYSLGQMYNDAVPLSIDNMDFIGEGMLFDKIHRIIDLLLEYKDREVMISCVGDSEFLRGYLLDRLWQMDFRACRFSNQLLDHINETQMTPGLCVFVNESGIALYDVGATLEEMGWKVIAITSSSETPLAGIASYTVEIRNRKSPVDTYLPNFFAARVMIFLELLFAEMNERKNKPFGK